MIVSAAQVLGWMAGNEVISDTNDLIDGLRSNTDALSEQTGFMITTASDITNGLTDGGEGCNDLDVSDSIDFANSFLTTAEELDSLTTEASDLLKELEDQDIEKTMTTYWNYIIACVFGVVWFLIIAGCVSVSPCVEKHCCQHFTACIGGLVIILLMVIVGFVLSAALPISDFCAGGYANTIQTLISESGASGDVGDVVEYYTECDDASALNAAADVTNPLSNLTSILNSTSAKLREAINAYDQSICSDSGLTGFKDAIGGVADASKAATDLFNLITCPNFTPLIDDLFGDVICTHLPNMLFFTWLPSIIIALCFWCGLMCLPCAVRGDDDDNWVEEGEFDTSELKF